MNVKDSMPSGFHDTSLVAALHEGSTLTLVVEYHDDDDIEQRVTVRILGLYKILANDIEISSFEMVKNYASIIDLDPSNDGFRLALMWVDFARKTDDFCLYEIFTHDRQIDIKPSHGDSHTPQIPQ